MRRRTISVRCWSAKLSGKTNPQINLPDGELSLSESPPIVPANTKTANAPERSVVVHEFRSSGGTRKICKPLNGGFRLHQRRLIAFTMDSISARHCLSWHFSSSLVHADLPYESTMVYGGKNERETKIRFCPKNVFTRNIELVSSFSAYHTS